MAMMAVMTNRPIPENHFANKLTFPLAVLNE